MQKGTIVYLYGESLYINLTNRCPNSCDFCIRNYTDNLGDADNLWLEEEPTADQVVSRIKEEICEKKTKVNEIIFCGYGEPMERLEELIDISKKIRAFTDKPIRINTNGLADLIHKKKTAPLLEGVVDAVSVSLNAPTAEKYFNLCHPEFGPQSFDAILKWTEDVKQYVPDVRMSVVGVIPEEDIQECRRIAEELGVKFRVR
ncbi:TIGR04100 family radical SAM protein [Aminipila luticellarii]|uniref:TIGR04100 family radical SAM protein n=1 Tax=Aminipila luticellarii TaxID=2507160 RepID=A0A410PU74_9FIRM|nr:TIGR04100 family radical SAM protein [Aminipila luticellarii]QAT42473.1 TIGR04100 family radical SAM protein [Aminipila luticellarii]